MNVQKYKRRDFLFNNSKLHIKIFHTWRIILCTLWSWLMSYRIYNSTTTNKQQQSRCLRTDNHNIILPTFSGYIGCSCVPPPSTPPVHSGPLPSCTLGPCIVVPSRIYEGRFDLSRELLLRDGLYLRRSIWL